MDPYSVEEFFITFLTQMLHSSPDPDPDLDPDPNQH
jgi:hypothetical protein